MKPVEELTMRKILISLAAAAALLAATTPAAVTLAADNSAALPLECSLPDAKTDHPEWFLKGGYCTNAFIQTDHYVGKECRHTS
jgi:hypothetical protein